MLLELLGLVVILGLPALIVGGMIWSAVREHQRDRNRAADRPEERALDASVEDVGVAVPRGAPGDRGPITGLGPGDQPSIGGF